MARPAPLNTAVVFVIFRRPDVTQMVFRAIAEARPPRLFLLSDAPRPDHPDEADLVDQTRAIVDNVDWPCEVHRRFAETNMGCEQSISTGLDWVFKHVDRAIVLEDDCLPNPSFFPFCEAMLERYETDSKVMSISGTQPLDQVDFTDHSIYFTKHFHCWGWATWKRAWNHYDREMRGHEEFLKHTLPTIAVSENEITYIQNSIKSTLSGRLDSWALRYTYAVLKASGVCVQPSVNLVSNLGDGPLGTHCNSVQEKSVFHRPTEMIQLVSLPSSITRNVEGERAWAEAFTRPRERGPILSITAWQRRLLQYRKSISKRLNRVRRAA